MRATFVLHAQNVSYPGIYADGLQAPSLRRKISVRRTAGQRAALAGCARRLLLALKESTAGGPKSGRPVRRHRPSRPRKSEPAHYHARDASIRTENSVRAPAPSASLGNADNINAYSDGGRNHLTRGMVNASQTTRHRLRSPRNAHTSSTTRAASARQARPAASSTAWAPCSPTCRC